MFPSYDGANERTQEQIQIQQVSLTLLFYVSFLSCTPTLLPSYRNAQFFQGREKVQRELVKQRLSLDASCPLTGLCISIAVFMTATGSRESRWIRGVSLDAPYLLKTLCIFIASACYVFSHEMVGPS